MREPTAAYNQIMRKLFIMIQWQREGLKSGGGYFENERKSENTLQLKDIKQ